ncbi:hypothetical protein [uncultured Alsobacter sp.]|uniref:hypothetical protein n=1 Tax=uncultured Alsobacter sp. TaxID=1748258 RepID=UPI0025CC2564|nr:hypothetical protein [uncultured Alsobacter sp.]
MSEETAARDHAGAVCDYKRILQRVLDNRPSGTRQRLATALGKNRSFVSQIANPAYPVPIPAQHLETIFELCHFSQEERRAFLGAYGLAHPARLKVVPDARRQRVVRLEVPDLGDPRRNRKVDALLAEFARSIAAIVDDTN